MKDVIVKKMEDLENTYELKVVGEFSCLFSDGFEETKEAYYIYREGLLIGIFSKSEYRLVWCDDIKVI